MTAGVSDGRAQGSITMRHEGLGATVSVKIDNARGDNPNPRRFQNNRVGEAVFSFDDGRTQTVPLDAGFFSATSFHRAQHPGNILSALAQGAEHLTTKHLDAQQQGGAQAEGVAGDAAGAARGRLSQGAPQTEQGAAQQAGKKSGIAARIVSMVRAALANKRGGNKAFVDFAPVTAEVAARIKENAGLEVSGYVHSLDESGARHIHDEHGDPETEAARGQIAITEEDFARLPEIVSAPDDVYAGETLADGTPTVIFKKRMEDGTVYYVQEARKGRKKLAAKTLWKTRSVPHAEASQAHTSETSARSTSTGADSVAQSGAVVAENATVQTDAASGDVSSAVADGQKPALLRKRNKHEEIFVRDWLAFNSRPVEIKHDPALYQNDLKAAQAHARRAYQLLVQATQKNGFGVEKDGLKIQFSGRGFKEVAHHSADRRVLAVLANLEELFGRAAYLYSSTDTKGKQQAKEFHFFGVKARFKEGDAYVLLEVLERDNGEFFYDADATSVELVDAQKEAAENVPLADQTKSGAGNKRQPLKGRLARWMQEVNAAAEELYFPPRMWADMSGSERFAVLSRDMELNHSMTYPQVEQLATLPFDEMPADLQRRLYAVLMLRQHHARRGGLEFTETVHAVATGSESAQQAEAFDKLMREKFGNSEQSGNAGRLQAGAERLQAAPSAPDGWVGLTPAQAAAEWDAMTAPERVKALDGTLLRSEGVELHKRFDMANQPFAQLTPEMQRRVAAHLTLQHEKGKRNGALVKQLLAQRAGRPLPETRGQTEKEARAERAGQQQQTEEASNGRYEAAAPRGRNKGDDTGDSGASHAQDARAHDDGDVRDESAAQLRTDADSASAAAGVHEREDGAGASDGEGGARAGNAKRRGGNPRDTAHSPQTGHDAHSAGGTGAVDAGNSAASAADGLAATADDAGGVAQDARQQHANERESGRTVLDFDAWQKARTPQFKAWFGGDWEVLHDLTVPEAATEEYARERLAELAGRDLRNDETGFVGRINRKQADKILSPLARDKSIANLKYEMDAAEAVARHYAMAARMEQLWKHAVYIGEFKDDNDEPGMHIYRFAVAVRQGGQVQHATILAKFDEKRQKDGSRRVYTLELHEGKALQSTLDSLAKKRMKPQGAGVPVRSAKEILRATEEKINPPFLNLTNPTTGEPWAEIVKFGGEGDRELAMPYASRPLLQPEGRHEWQEYAREMRLVMGEYKTFGGKSMEKMFMKGDREARALFDKAYKELADTRQVRSPGVRDSKLFNLAAELHHSYDYKAEQDALFAQVMAASQARQDRIRAAKFWDDKPQEREAMLRAALPHGSPRFKEFLAMPWEQVCTEVDPVSLVKGWRAMKAQAAASTQQEGAAKKGIGNFGERISDNSKRVRLINYGSLTDIAERALSDIWPLDSVREIEDTFLAAVAHAARAAIPAKPKNEYKVGVWAEHVRDALRMAKDAARLKLDVDGFRQYAGHGKFYFMDNVADKVELLTNIDRAFWGGVEDVRLLKDETGIDARVRLSGSRERQSIQGKDIADIASQVSDRLAAHLAKEKPRGKRDVSFEVVRARGKTIIQARGSYAALKEFEGATQEVEREAQAYIDAHHDELLAEWERFNTRDGRDVREGKDVTPEMFSQAFGFRGVEFGRATGQKERQTLLNRAFDALHDLADLLGAPTQALSLNGSLGLAFGSRGRGNANAHFEPDSLVINLTRERGAGLLAHEWFHALDNYFSRMRGAIYGSMTQLKEGVAAGNVRAEMVKAFNKLVMALNASPMAKRSRELDDSLGTRRYFTRTEERAARAFENYVIAKMQAQGVRNNYLAYVLPEYRYKAGHYPYLLAEEAAPIEKAFDNLFAKVKTKKTDKGVALFSRRENSAWSQLRAEEVGRMEIAPVSLTLEGWKGDSRQLSALARKVYASELQGTDIDNASMGADVKFSAEGKGEAFGARDKLKDTVRAEVVRVLRQLVHDAVKVSEVAPDGRRVNDSAAFHTLLAPLSVNGQLHAARITVREARLVPEGETPHRFYDIALVQMRQAPIVHGFDDQGSTSRPASIRGRGITVSDLARAVNAEVTGGKDAPAFRRAEPVQGTAQTFAQWKRERDAGETDLKYPDWLKHGTGVTQADVEAVRALNEAMVRYGLGKDWSNAYEAVELPDALSGIREAVQAAFGRDIRAVAPTAAEYDTFNGVYLPKRPGEVFVNVRSAVGFVQVTGHELLHELKRTAPELYEWFKQHAEQYLTDVEGYRTRLNRLLQAGERPYGTELAKEELLGDFTGDAMADPQFLAQLAEDDGNRFRQLLRTVTRWLDTVWGKLRGFDSHEHVQDVEALRKHLKNVLLAWSNGKGVDFIARMEKLDLAREHLRAAGIDWKQPDSARSTAAGTNRGQNVPSGAGGKMMFSREEAAAYGATPEALQAEYDAVVARYKGTPQWMKAPNGKPTKLTERQWVQVRTPRFKAWFGNWEAKRARDALMDMDAVRVNVPQDWALLPARDWREAVKVEYGRAAKQGNVKMRDGREVRLSPVGFKETKQHSGISRDALNLLANIREVLEQAHHVASLPHEKAAVTDSVRAWHYYAAKVQMDGREMFARLVLREDVNGTIYYDNDLSSIEALEKETGGRGNHAIRTKSGTPSTSADGHSLAELLSGGKTGEVSAVVDEETGEPLVVYHGSRWNPLAEAPGKAVFRHDAVRNASEGVGFYFTAARELAQGWGEAGGYFLNIRKPANARAQLQMSDKALRGKLREVVDILRGKGYDFYEQIETDLLDTLSSETVESALDYLLDAQGFVDGEVDSEQFITDLRKAEAEVFGVDGYHSPDYSDGKGVFVAFDPTQIKSATANTGAFGIDEGDVRFSFLGKRGAQSLDAAEEVTHRMDNLAVAREMEEAGRDAKTVKLATGWERGADGKWRYEIDDNYNTFHAGGDAVARRDWPGYAEDVDRIGELLNKKENAMLFDLAPLTDAEARELAELQEKRRADIEHWRQRRDKGNARLMDVLDAPELFRAYPQLKNVTVYFADLPRGGATGSITPDGKNIKLARWLDSHNKETVLHHEIQHAIQIIEGFAPGINPVSAYSGETAPHAFKELERLRKKVGTPRTREQYAQEAGWDAADVGTQEFEDAYRDYVKTVREAARGKASDRAMQETAARNVYHRTAGETEARNVQSRLGMTPEQRRATLAAETEDVAREDQIVLREMVEAASAGEPVGNSDGLRFSRSGENSLPALLAKTARAYGGEKAWQEARNDGRTELSYEHWLAARSPQFKELYGDWQAAQARARVAQQKAVHIDVPEGWSGRLAQSVWREAVWKRYQAIAAQSQKEPVQMKDGRSVRMARRGFNQTRQDRGADRDSLNMLLGIREVLAAAEHTGSMAHEQENAHDATRAWHYYLAKVKIGGREKLARLVLREDSNGTFYFDNQLSGMENASSARQAASLSKESGARRTAGAGVNGNVAEEASDAQEPSAETVQQFIDAHQKADENKGEGAQGFVHGDRTRPYTPQRVELSDEQRARVDAAMQQAARQTERLDADEVQRRQLAAGLRALAASEGWQSVPAADKQGRTGSKYFVLRKDGVGIPARASDHAITNIGRYYETTAINFAPQDTSSGFAYDTLESVLWKLRNASLDESGRLQLGGKPAVMFSRAAAASFGTITPEQEAALRATGLLRQPKSIKERFRELTNNLGKRLVQGIVDQYAPLKELDFRSYVLARMSKGTDGTFEAMLHYGTPRVNGDTVEVDTSTGGLMGVLSELSGEQDRFLAWIAANRAEQLTKEGREFLFTPEQIQHLKALNQGTMKDGTSRAMRYAATLQKFNDFQDAVLAIAEARGLIDAVTDTGTPVITGYEIGAGGNGAAFPPSPSLQSAPLVRKEQIVAALKERIAQLEVQVNGTDSVEAVEFNEKSPAAIWVDSTVQSDGIDPTSIRSTGDVFSLAQRVENFNASNMRAVLDPQTKEPVAGVVERFQKEQGDEDTPQFSRAAAASFGTITPEQEAGFFPPRHKTPLRGVFCWVPCAGNSGGKCALFAGRRAVGGGDNVGQWCACRGVAAGREDGRLRGERRWPRKATPRRQNSQPVSGLRTHGQTVTCRCRGSLRPFSS